MGFQLVQLHFSSIYKYMQSKNYIQSKNYRDYKDSNKPRMFYVKRSSTNICSSALTFLLMVVFSFLTLASTICKSKEIVQFKYQS